MNEGQVRVGSRTLEIGRLRSWVSLGAGIALGAGLAIGVVSAAPNGSGSELAGLPQTPRPSQAQSAVRVPRPLHQMLLQRISGQEQRLALPGRFAAGRVTEVDSAGGTVTVALVSYIVLPSSPLGSPSGEVAPPTRVIRVVPQTRVAQQRPRTGDFVLAVGRPERDGSLTARSLAVRRPGQIVRRQAALTTRPAPARA